tara:strand:- start:156 stop:290 length:135 start_codon:yes stop_codon:yes gene_type:complete
VRNKNRIIKKMNEGQESDVTPYVWKSIPDSLKYFWNEYFNNKNK